MQQIGGFYFDSLTLPLEAGAEILENILSTRFLLWFSKEMLPWTENWHKSNQLTYLVIRQDTEN